MGRANLAVIGVVMAMTTWLAGPGLAQVELPAGQLVKAQGLTGPRLIKPGESIDFRFCLPGRVTPGDLAVFPRYLEQSSHRAKGFTGDGNLDWLEALPRQAIPLEFEGGRASAIYESTRRTVFVSRTDHLDLAPGVELTVTIRE